MVQLDDPKARAAYEEEELPRMSFGDHLDELRRRIIYSLLAIVAATIVVLPFKATVTEIIIEPYRVQWRIGFDNWIARLQTEKAAGTLDERGAKFLEFCVAEHDRIFAGAYRWDYLLKEDSGYPVPYSLYATGGLEDMLAFMWASLIFALVIASPVVLWQAWSFVAAGLYKHERAVFHRYFWFMLLLAAVGVGFGYRVALPFSLGFLISLMDPSQVGAIFSVGQFLSLLFITTAAMGVMFQVPVVMVALQKIGLVRHKTFKKHWRATILIIAIAAAVFTPPEPVSMLLMMIPMVGLYGLGLLLTRIGQRHEAPQGGA